MTDDEERSEDARDASGEDEHPDPEPADSGEPESASEEAADGDDRDRGDAPERREREERTHEAPLSGLRDRIGGERSDDARDADDRERGDASERRDREEGAQEGPLSGLRDRVESERSGGAEGEGESEPAFEDLFTEMETEEVDSGELWDELLASETDSGPVATGERVETDTERDVRLIDARTCHRCQYFGEPPELHCTHEGTDILEVVDVDRYKVADCPMVGEEGQQPETDPTG